MLLICPAFPVYVKHNLFTRTIINYINEILVTAPELLALHGYIFLKTIRQMALN